MANTPSSGLKSTGTFSWAMGVDSLKPTTVRGPSNPHGLTKEQNHWQVNCTNRGGTLSPRDPWVKRGWINQSLPPQIIPGTPQQTINQPNVVVQTQNQTLFVSEAWTIPSTGDSATMSISAPYGGYVGNVGDVMNMTDLATDKYVGQFLVTAFTSNPSDANSVTFQTISLPSGGETSIPKNDAVFLQVVSLGPGLPQPPLIIPPGPPTVIAAQPYYQGGIIYNPASGTPYGIMVIGGHVVKCDVNFLTGVIDLSDTWNLYLPITQKCYFCQAETFLVIQAGDYDSATGNGTLPLFWDGTTLYRSNGLTGVTVVGEPYPNIYTLTSANAWTPNATTTNATTGTVGGVSTLTLTDSYPGNLYDNIELAIQSTGQEIGVFRVVGLSGNQITLQSLFLVYTGGDPPGQQTSGTIFTATLSDPTYSTGTPPSISAATQTSVSNLTIGDGSWTVPSVIGQEVELDLTSLYFGSVGDTVNLYNVGGTINYGTFTVVSFNDSFQLILKYAAAASPSYSGNTIFGTMLAVVTASRSFSQNFPSGQQQGVGGQFTVPAAGGTTTVYWPPFSTTPLCKLYDNVVVTDQASGLNLGFYRVVALGGYFNGDHNFPYATFQALVPNSEYVGTAFGGTLTMTLAGPSAPPISGKTIYPPAYSGYLVVNAGTWTIPDIGQSVSLQLVWPSLLGASLPSNIGPSYPGNIGDIVQLLSGASTIAYFQVTAFDLNGNITLTTFSNSTYTTPAANIGQSYTGEQVLGFEIMQLPSSIGENVSQLPAATAMVYYAGIIWYAQGNVVSGGDIRGGPSGTNAPSYTNSVLNVTENPLALGGDGFALPIAGNITGMGWPQQQNASFGQGLLYIGTINGFCSLQVPTSRAAWIAMTASALPQINVVLGGKPDAPGYGPVNDWCITSINGDLYFQTQQPGITSLINAQRYFQQWGNIDISNNEQRLWKFTNTALLGNISGVYFNKRMLMTALPQTSNYGVIHQAVVPLDMCPIDTFEELVPPNWEGMHEGLQIFQLVTSGEFDGQQRLFAVTLNPNNPGEIDLWESVPATTALSLGDTNINANGQNVTVPIEWQFETPAFTWEAEADLKQLMGGSLWVDSIAGEVIFKVEWRPDFAACWQPWCTWTECFAPNNLTNPCVTAPTPYPVNLPPGYKPSMDFPEPPNILQPETGWPAAQGFQFQLRVTVIGQCRARGLALHGQSREKNIYDRLVGAWQKIRKFIQA